MTSITKYVMLIALCLFANNIAAQDTIEKPNETHEIELLKKSKEAVNSAGQNHTFILMLIINNL